MASGVELLAPCGDTESFFAAVNSGADAVYLGLPDFNARIRAENFDYEKLKDAIEYAHFRGVKVYITVNTLVKNSEISLFIANVKRAVELKADAFIVQDLGAVYMLKKCFPNIELHASTQMGIHNLYGAKEAEALGIKRIVLSRETKLVDILEIKQNTSLELEFFVQGALCVCFSGNCYFSSLEYDKSGNRGLCAQLCRHNYNYRGKDGYYLSARDLSLLKNLKTLKDAGVTSFKIEGRLRRSGYVAEAVSVYREALDNINGDIDFDSLKLRLLKVFNRGEYLSDAYLYGAKNVINAKEQNHQGIYIGKINKVEPFKDLYKITIKSSHPLSSGDGLKLFDRGVEALSLGVGNVEKKGKDEYVIYSKNKPIEGMNCNLILDSVDEKTALSRIKSVPLKISFNARENEKIILKGVSGNIEIFHTSEYSCPKAEKEETKTEEIAGQLNKTKDSGFEIEIDTLGSKADKVFIPKSVINAARRALLSEMKKALIEDFEKCNNILVNEEEILKYSNLPIFFENLICDINYDCFDKTDNDNSVFVISPRDYSEAVVKSEIKKIKNQNKKIALELPLIANNKDIEILENLIASVKDDIDFIVVNNLYGYGFKKFNIPLIAGYGMNIYNDVSAAVNESLGAKVITKSIESKEDIKINTKEGILKNFKVPLMTFCNCFNQSLNLGSCKNCSKKNNLEIFKENEAYNLISYKVHDCYYRLYKST